MKNIAKRRFTLADEQFVTGCVCQHVKIEAIKKNCGFQKTQIAYFCILFIVISVIRQPLTTEQKKETNFAQEVRNFPVI